MYAHCILLRSVPVHIIDSQITAIENHVNIIKNEFNVYRNYIHLES